MALNEGFVTTQTAMSSLYTGTCAKLARDLNAAPLFSAMDGPVNPRNGIHAAGKEHDTPDLRAALLQLQWVCLRTKAAESLQHGAPAQPPQSEASKNDVKVTKPGAFEEIRLARDLSERLSLSDVAFAYQDQEDVLPYETISQACRSGASTALAAQYDRAPHIPLRDFRLDDAMRAEALGLAGDTWLKETALPPELIQALLPAHLARWSAHVELGRLVYSQQTARMLALLHVCPGEQLPHSAATVDYAPCVRRIALCDEQKIQAYTEQLHLASLAMGHGVSGSSRATRYSARSVLDGWASGGPESLRYLPFGPDETAAAKESHFLAW